jgi:hypothetical protein
MKYQKEIVIFAIFAIFIFSSGCMGIQAPVFSANSMKLSIPITPAPVSYIDKNAPTPTPTINVTVTETTKPKFVYA